MRLLTAYQWAESITGGLPPRWRARLLRAHRARATANGERSENIQVNYRSGKNILNFFADIQPAAQVAATVAANIELRYWIDMLSNAKLALNSSDDEVRAAADHHASTALNLAARFAHPSQIRVSMSDYAARRGLTPPSEKNKDHAAIKRLSCTLWWRRGLRRHLANCVERAALALGYVHRAGDLYVSAESLARRQQQVRRNNLTLASTKLESDDGEILTLAEIAATGIANKSIRRGELMTRIRGFEKIAADCAHSGLFVTLTCPSRMHPYRSLSDKKSLPNPLYDKTTPSDAQRYLCKLWSRARAALARRGVSIYGFRIAEPHHDGTPHWHMMFFLPPGQVDVFRAVMSAYALADSPGEPGATAHRITFTSIDPALGSAAGYIAKYIAKNIDGEHITEDLFGHPGLESARRVDAWASTWRIRQFQQVGGAPVGVWRELRRIKKLPSTAPEHLVAAHAATNKITTDDGVIQADWAAYTIAQGGVSVGRGAKIQPLKKNPNRLNRYGEPMSEKICGVQTAGWETYRDGIIPDRWRSTIWEVSSDRKSWHPLRAVPVRALPHHIYLTPPANDSPPPAESRAVA
jgi:Bacteriophage replication gene A protein (GPA)